MSIIKGLINKLFDGKMVNIFLSINFNIYVLNIQKNRLIWVRTTYVLVQKKEK